MFAGGDGDPLVYCATPAVAATRERLGGTATVVDAGADPDASAGSATTSASAGVRRLMVEGGQHVLGQFLGAGLADELQLVVAPVLRRRLPGSAPGRRRADARAAGAGPTSPRCAGSSDVVLLRYALSARFELDGRAGPPMTGNRAGAATRAAPPPATIRTEVMVPLRFSDGFATTGAGAHLRRAGRRARAPRARARRPRPPGSPAGRRRGSTARRWCGCTASA